MGNCINTFQTWCNKKVVWKLKRWHACMISIFIIAVPIIIFAQRSSSVSGDESDHQAADAKIACLGALFHGTWEYETIRNIRGHQETELKLAKIFNSSDLSSCFSGAKVLSFRNTTVAFQLKFLPPKDNKESLCQAGELKSNVYFVLNEYIRKQDSNDPLKIKRSSLGIQEVQ